MLRTTSLPKQKPKTSLDKNGILLSTHSVTPTRKHLMSQSTPIVSNLIERFVRNREAYKNQSYNETQVRRFDQSVYRLSDNFYRLMENERKTDVFS